MRLNNLSSSLFGVAFIGLCDYTCGELQESVAGGRGGVEDSGRAGIAAFADTLHEWYLCQEGIARLFG